MGLAKPETVAEQPRTHRRSSSIPPGADRMCGAGPRRAEFRAAGPPQRDRPLPHHSSWVLGRARPLANSPLAQLLPPKACGVGGEGLYRVTGATPGPPLTPHGQVWAQEGLTPAPCRRLEAEGAGRSPFNSTGTAPGESTGYSAHKSRRSGGSRRWRPLTSRG